MVDACKQKDFKLEDVKDALAFGLDQNLEISVRGGGHNGGGLGICDGGLVIDLSGIKSSCDCVPFSHPLP